MAGEVFIDLDGAAVAFDGVGSFFCQASHRTSRAGVTFAQEQDVGRDLGAGIALEGRVGQPDGAQQIGMSGQMPTDGVIALVQRVPARDQRHDAARPGFLK